jgi:cyclopropane fatty-acyl-phospholipid synthase-like methyltransferase
MSMISAKQRALVQKQMQRDESKIVNIVLKDERQVAGEIDRATSEGIFLVDGSLYSYEDIQEINGLN